MTTPDLATMVAFGHNKLVAEDRNIYIRLTTPDLATLVAFGHNKLAAEDRNIYPCLPGEGRPSLPGEGRASLPGEGRGPGGGGGGGAGAAAAEERGAGHRWRVLYLLTIGNLEVFVGRKTAKYILILEYHIKNI